MNKQDEKEAEEIAVKEAEKLESDQVAEATKQNIETDIGEAKE